MNGCVYSYVVRFSTLLLVKICVGGKKQRLCFTVLSEFFIEKNLRIFTYFMFLRHEHNLLLCFLSSGRLHSWENCLPFFVTQLFEKENKKVDLRRGLVSQPILCRSMLISVALLCLVLYTVMIGKEGKMLSEHRLKQKNMSLKLQS